MNFISTYKLLNDINDKNKYKNDDINIKLKENKEFIQLEKKMNRKSLHKMNRIRSMDNFMKFQWSWTL
tara:strand:+ start:167 stop:370 length:204 start_codon:yes stop_codon:yes gene_type:complete